MPLHPNAGKPVSKRDLTDIVELSELFPEPLFAIHIAQEGNDDFRF